MRRAAFRVVMILHFLVICAASYSLKASEHENINPYEYIVFSEENAAVQTDGTADVWEYTEHGLQISGKNHDISGKMFTIDGLLDFGDQAQKSAGVNRVRIDGLARTGTRMIVKLFLDDEQVPFAEKQLKTQSEKGNWTEEKPVFFEIEEPFFGLHTLRFSVEAPTTPDDKKAEALIRSIRFYRESIPTVYVNIDETLGSIEAMNADPVHETVCYGSLTIRVPDGYVSEYDEKEPQAYSGGEYQMEYIRGRGESTWQEAKKPYKIKLEKSEELFGMGASKHWALIANFFDRSFVRNRITYRLGEAIGLAYTPKLVPVDVVINGDYQGLYYLSETIRVEDERIGIDNLEDFTAGDEDITGGYLLSNRRPWDTDGYPFETDRSGTMLVVSPEELSDPDVPDEKLQEMYDYIIGYFKEAENAVFGPGGLDENGRHYTEFLDLDSMARYYLIQEFSMNRDAYRTDSSYLYKPRGGKLYWGPLWDFDLNAWGGDTTETYLADNETAASSTQEIYQQYAWCRVLRGDPVFVEAVQKAWGGKENDDPAALRRQLQELVRDGGILDQYEAELGAAAENNADIPGYTFDYLAEAGDLDGELIDTDFHGEIYRLKRWIKARMDWFDDHIDHLLDENARVDLTFCSDGNILDTWSVVNGETVYELPIPESEDGRFFAGWYGDCQEYDEETGEEYTASMQYRNGSSFTEDTVLTAKWETKDEITLPEAIFLEREEAYVKTDSYKPFSCTIMPEGAETTVFYTSSDPSLAYIDQYDELCVRGKTGDVTITAETVNGLKAEYLLHIVAVEETDDFSWDSDQISDAIYSFGVDEEEIHMKPGEYRKINITFDPEYALKPEFRILNAQEEIAGMTQEGVLVARSKGTAVIFIVNDRKEDAVRLNVTVE